MLLLSDRHTKDDLAWWAEQERADIVHGRSIEKSGKVNKAIETILAFARCGPCYAAVSWGKDSVVIADLVAMAGVDIPVVNIWQDGPQHDPYVERVRDCFLKSTPMDYHEIHVAADDLEQDDLHRAPSLEIGIREAAKRFGSRYVGGVRAAESGVRALSARMNRPGTCQPIQWWTDADVFGHLAYRGLPVHPAYGMTGGGIWKRHRIRVSIIGGAKGRQFGRLTWERQYFGDQLNRAGITE